MFTLKEYQKRALDTLEDFLQQCLTRPVEEVFDQHAHEVLGAPKSQKIIYHDTFNGAPSFCIRIPTGGGKTVIGVCAIKRIDSAYLQSGNPVVLWLTPSDAITSQTIKALEDPAHPYRQALNADFPNVRVVSISDVALLQPSDFNNSCVVIVSTIQTFNVEDESIRNVYRYNESLSPFFTGLNIEQAKDLARVQESELDENGVLTPRNVGSPKHSIANLLRLYRPIVIVDEAHNNRTERFFNSLDRIAPSVILELTATPQVSNNVVYQVSAWELKANDMVKLPVILGEFEQTGWKTCVDASVTLRQKLEKAAEGESDNEYVRPIVLIQAQRKGEEPLPETVRDYLVNTHNIPIEEIAIATGNTKELEGVDLFSRTCRIRYVITVQALKEGWDCSFAYVLCSLQNVQSAKDTEQLLGRVLRMPYAKSRQDEVLNKSYANVLSPRMSLAATLLQDALVDKMGFNRLEASAMFEAATESELGTNDDDDLTGDLFEDYIAGKESSVGKPVVVPVETKKDPEELKRSLTENGVNAEVIETNKKGLIYLRTGSNMPHDQQTKLVNIVTKGETNAKSEKFRNDFQAAIAAKRLSVNAEKNQKTPFPMLPLLCYRDGDEIVALDSGTALSEPWKPQNFSTKIRRFHPNVRITSSAIDVNQSGHIQKVEVDTKLQVKIQTLWGEETITVDQFASDMAWDIRRTDVANPDMVEFCSRVIRNLINEGNKLETLLMCRVQLSRELKALLEQNYTEALKRGFQNKLDLLVETPDDDGCRFAFDKFRYEARNVYDTRDAAGLYEFRKHFYPQIHDLKAYTDHGTLREEFICARAIDQNSKTKRWVRNVEKSKYSFCLPTSNGNFYPDFVVELTDGRILVVEYKGRFLESTEDSAEKRRVGQLWEANSGGHGLFLFAVKEDEHGNNVEEQIRLKIDGIF